MSKNKTSSNYGNRVSGLGMVAMRAVSRETIEGTRIADPKILATMVMRLIGHIERLENRTLNDIVAKKRGLKTPRD